MERLRDAPSITPQADFADGTASRRSFDYTTCYFCRWNGFETLLRLPHKLILTMERLRDAPSITSQADFDDGTASRRSFDYLTS
jgi:hypothetical protein